MAKIIHRVVMLRQYFYFFFANSWMIGKQKSFLFPSCHIAHFSCGQSRSVHTQQQPFDLCFVRRKTLLSLCAKFDGGKLMLVNVGWAGLCLCAFICCEKRIFNSFTSLTTPQRREENIMQLLFSLSKFNYDGHKNNLQGL